MKKISNVEVRRRFDAALACLQSGDLEASETVFRLLVANDPRNGDALHLLGVTRYMKREYADAEKWIRKAAGIRAAPAYLTNLALALAAQGKFLGAIEAYQGAINAGGGTAKVHNNLGNLLVDQKQLVQAEQSYRKAIEADKAHSLAHKNLALLLAKRGCVAEAEAEFQQALALDPTSEDFWLCYGGMLEHEKRFAEAEVAFRKGKRWDSLQFVKRQSASWEGLAALDEAALDMIASGRADDLTPWSLLFMPALTPKLHLEAGRRFALSRWGRQLGSRRPSGRNGIGKSERLRVGYLSADFFDHATMHLLAGVLERHDVTRFDVHLYSHGPRRTDTYVERMERMPLTLHEVSMLPDQQIAEQIAADRIELLIDLKGYTTGARLGVTALKPAPVTVSWLGYPGTLGHPGLADFIIGDPVVTPPEDAANYSETLALMPHCYQPNDEAHDLAPPPDRAKAGLPEQGFVFCSFNQTVKFTERIFSIWLRLLQEVPGSVLWLLNPSNEEAVLNLRLAVEASGLAPGRLVLADRLPRRHHLARLQLADLALDTYPVGSHTTGSDALIAGVPLVARTGELFASRVSESLLRTLGLEQLVAGSDEAYFEVALSLAKDPDRLRQVRALLSAQRSVSPLFDPTLFAHDLEKLYEAIWRRASGPDRHSRLPVRGDSFA